MTLREKKIAKHNQQKLDDLRNELNDLDAKYGPYEEMTDADEIRWQQIDLEIFDIMNGIEQ